MTAEQWQPVEQWQRGNDEYLSAALAWLRLRLEKLAQTNSPVAVSQPQVEHRSLFGKRNMVAALPAPSGDEELQRTSEAMNAAEARPSPSPSLKLIGDRLGLSTFERQVLLLCSAMELDTRTSELCNAAQNRPYPTFALALTLFDNPAWDVLSPERPLRYWRLIEINQPAAQPLTTSALRIDERIVNAVKGLHYLDDRLTPLLQPLEPSTQTLPPSQQGIVETARNYLQHNQSGQPWPLLELVGADALSSQFIARTIATSLGVPLYRLPIEVLPTTMNELETLARLWQRESLLSPVALYLEAHDLEESSPQYGALKRFLSRINGITMLAVRSVCSELGRNVVVLDVAKPTSTEQCEAWLQVTGHEPLAGALAAQFDLNLETIGRIAAETGQTTSEWLPEKVWEGCRKNTRPRLESLAQRIETKATWEHLVLPDTETKFLHQLSEQVRERSTVYDTWGFAKAMNRGLGISALFAGESGTGKTMAAEVIANDLRLDLYRIDLSSVVSKYIGETEKNLRKLFDAAENGGAILFFDEADALFGKRSEVKDAHDRYANIEINYLLQRMEQYRGLAILATNMKSSLDAAFVRRLRFVVNFPFPALSERKRMWQNVFPASTPVKGLDYERLAKLNLTGAGIHNAALNAAFLAATRGVVTMKEVLEAARYEFKKLERPINEAEFRYVPENGKSETSKEEIYA
jgi:ATPase family associated with various cellular activities (AAA)